MAVEAMMDKHEVTQAEIARKIGITPQRLSNYLRSDNYPNQYVLWLFCRRWGVTSDWIYQGTISGLPSELADFFQVAATESREELSEQVRRTRRKA
jgi:transcriptional regulator with XRE-family HTH domain